MENNTANPMPRIGDPAPSFTAKTTQGPINFPSDYKGKWKILFSHPADFTPVCTSEFMTFASMASEFEALNCQLVGLSVDGLYSHIAWLRTIQNKIEYKDMKNVEVKFPLIEDITMEVAKLYGMIQPGESQTSAVRAVFFIDPQDKIRTILYYPLSLGRNFDEIKRVLIEIAPQREADLRPLRGSPSGRLAPGRRGHRAHRRIVRSGQGPHERRRRADEVLRLVLLHQTPEQGRSGKQPGINRRKDLFRIRPPCA